MASQIPSVVDVTLTKRAKQAALNLRMNSDFSAVLQYVEARLSLHQQQLVMVPADQVPTAQGRARELLDLFDVLKPKETP